MEVAVGASRNARARTDSHAMTNGDLLSIEEAAAALNVKPRFIRRLIYERRIDFVKLGAHVRIERRALELFVARGRELAHPETPRGERRP